MKAFLTFAVLLLSALNLWGQAPIYRQSYTTNSPGKTPDSLTSLPAGSNAFALFHIAGDGTLYAAPQLRLVGTTVVFSGAIDAPSITVTNITAGGTINLTNATVYGNLTVITNIIVEGAGPGTVMFFDSTGTNALILSGPTNFGFTGTNTLFLPTSLGDTNSVLQNDGNGNLSWRTNVTIPGTLDLSGPGVGFLTMWDSTGTNFVQLTVSNVLGTSYTNYLPFSASGGGDQIWATNGSGQVILPGDVAHDILLSSTNYSQMTLEGPTNSIGNRPAVIIYADNPAPVIVLETQSEFDWAVLDPLMDWNFVSRYTWGAKADLASNEVHTVWLDATNTATLMTLYGDGALSVAGDISGIKGVTYSWPSSTANGTLLNDGSGNLTWSGPTSASVTQTNGVQNFYARYASSNVLSVGMLYDDGGTTNVGGTITSKGKILIPDGDASAPGLAFSAQANGMYRADHGINFVMAGANTTVSMGDGTFSSYNGLTAASLRGTNGVTSFASDASVAISTTGWTNSLGKNATVFIEGTGVTFTLYNASGTAMYTNAATVNFATVPIQASGKVIITAGTGVSGRAVPW